MLADSQHLKKASVTGLEAGAATADFALPGLLRAGNLKMQGLLERAFASVETSAMQFELMFLVGRHPDATQSELAEALSVNRATIVGWVEQLVVDGLVKRSAQLSDRRIKRLSLTAKGRRRLALLERRFEEALRPLWLQLGPTGYFELLNLLGRLDRATGPQVRIRSGAGDSVLGTGAG